MQESNGKTAEEQFREWMNSQSGYIGKSNKAKWWENYNQGQANQQNLDQLFSGENPNFTVNGQSVKENTGRIEGLNRARILTGQNPYQIGADYQEAYGNIKKRTEQSDTASELIRNSKAGAVADTRNAMQAQGVKGGAAAGAASAVERQKSYDVNNQLAENSRQAQNDYLNAVKSNANFTQASEMNYGAMATGGDVQMPVQNSNGFGTVICTELFRQGYFSKEIYEIDRKYGIELRAKTPHIYEGYIYLASPLVERMQKSKRFTKLIAFFAVPWAHNMAGQKNLLGKFVAVVGEPLCGIVGKIIGRQYENCKTL